MHCLDDRSCLWDGYSRLDVFGELIGSLDIVESVSEGDTKVEDESDNAEWSGWR